jgi:hypothetical protein
MKNILKNNRYHTFKLEDEETVRKRPSRQAEKGGDL